jgi:hypothetical protein
MPAKILKGIGNAFDRAENLYRMKGLQPLLKSRLALERSRNQPLPHQPQESISPEYRSRSARRSILPL